MGRLSPAALRRAVALPPGVLAATLLLVACQEGSNQACISAPFTVRDSAGVVIATTGECDARRPLGWAVAVEPDLELGGEEDPPFFGARDVRRLANGTLAVLDGITREVRFLGEGGELRLSLGGRGRGPGEFVSPRLLSRHSHHEGPDSLGVLLFDSGLSRLSWVSVGGSVASETFPPREDLGGVVGYVGGRLLTRRRSTPSSFDPGIDQTGPEAFLLVDPWTAAVLTVAEVEVPRTFSFFSFGSLVGLRFPFEVSSAVAVGRDRFWMVGERRSEVWEYDREGQLSRVLRIAESPRKATRRDLDLFIDVMQRSVSTSEAAALWDREIRGLPWKGRLPAFDTLVVDDAGLLWARRYSVDPDAPRQWVVFGEGGRALGTVALPSGLSVAQIGHDFVLGMWRDTLGVRLVRRHALLRAPSQAEGFPSPPSPPTPQRGPAAWEFED